MSAELAIDPDAGTTGLPEIRIIPASAVWDTDAVLIADIWKPSPVMHLPKGAFRVDGQCGAELAGATMLRYDHARRFARHCQRCLRSAP